MRVKEMGTPSDPRRCQRPSRRRAACAVSARPRSGGVGTARVRRLGRARRFRRPCAGAGRTWRRAPASARFAPCVPRLRAGRPGAVVRTDVEIRATRAADSWADRFDATTVRAREKEEYCDAFVVFRVADEKPACVRMRLAIPCSREPVRLGLLLPGRPMVLRPCKVVLACEPPP